MKNFLTVNKSPTVVNITRRVSKQADGILCIDMVALTHFYKLVGDYMIMKRKAQGRLENGQNWMNSLWMVNQSLITAIII
ncbi:unnamed protein product [Paramecium sonneborni]|uniref:Uncharacterized protein n=1 Tax=Paramecium sonneborni TaxID=65129 RepID=A0A8S1LZZ8_9CILI|nr:unnamed protein product [Paramecium sonneborni]